MDERVTGTNPGGQIKKVGTLNARARSLNIHN